MAACCTQPTEHPDKLPLCAVVIGVCLKEIGVVCLKERAPVQVCVSKERALLKRALLSITRHTLPAGAACLG